jgi:DNA-binding response OmpR family regulator
MKHILLFQDEHDVGIMLRRILERRYFVAVTTGLNDARQMLERVKFDLIIASIHLPDGTAFEVMEMAKQRGIRTFLMTLSSSQRVHGHGMRSAQDYRKRAARAKRLAAGTSDHELQERIEAIARGYEAVAESIERLGEEPKSDQ